MFRFNFNRAVILGSVVKLPGKILQISTEFHGDVRLPKGSVHLTTTRHLSDSSVRVVDFGRQKEGQPPTKAIIAAGRMNRLPEL